MYQTKDNMTPRIIDTEAGQAIKAAIEARFVAQNSVLVAQFEDVIDDL